ncbi:flagellar biosynthesis protein FlgO [Pseudoalteromonas sp. JBTF-M23]|uniref:Flagellar biosynthesis protein FlgO n=1 Tax=Pseudoalteromonas caenipelagi TaxID=2726988 RepID=A0A849VDY1_9GAMM|nr:FlgO family outer membrane protein [Pseudoalteromonas caenipelagi]NOU50753.1 flagellar biosynthesis protein FlgO [Pseudoalteromonas caenipelagi]
MKQQYYLLAAAFITLGGCQLMSVNQVAVIEPKAPTSQIDALYDEAQRQKQEDELDNVQNSRRYSPVIHNLQLANYVEQMALELVDTMNSDQDINIAVASFVDFDSNLRTTNQLGNQIAETFIHQLQKFGYGVVDFKTTNSVSVTQKGDLSFSRDVKALTNKRVASHVLSGTMIYRSSGVEVNARVTDIDSKQVVASTRKLVPSYVLYSEELALFDVR